MIDYYNLLGVSSDATADQIKRAFRKQAKLAHPDAHPDGTIEKREAQKRRFIQLAQAYEALKDPAGRARYHRQWSAAQRAETKSRAQASPRDRAGPFRSAQAGFGSARRAQPKPPQPDPPNADSLDDLLRGAEELSGRFGLSLRHPLSELLETLVDWAREVFAQVMEPLEKGAPSSRRTHGEEWGKRPSQSNPDPKTNARKTNRGEKPDGNSGKGSEEDEMEAELERWKKRATGKNPASPSEPELDSELKKLKKKMDRR